MDPIIVVALITSGEAAAVTIFGLLYKARNERVKRAVGQQMSDAESRMKEWDLLLQNARKENDRLMVEINYWRTLALRKEGNG